MEGTIRTKSLQSAELDLHKVHTKPNKNIHNIGFETHQIIPAECSPTKSKLWIVISVLYLTLNATITTAADDIHKYFLLFFRENKT